MEIDERDPLERIRRRLEQQEGAAAGRSQAHPNSGLFSGPVTVENALRTSMQAQQSSGGDGAAQPDSSTQQESAQRNPLERINQRLSEDGGAGDAGVPTEDDESQEGDQRRDPRRRIDRVLSDAGEAAFRTGDGEAVVEPNISGVPDPQPPDPTNREGDVSDHLQQPEETAVQSALEYLTAPVRGAADMTAAMIEGSSAIPAPAQRSGAAAERVEGESPQVKRHREISRAQRRHIRETLEGESTEAELAEGVRRFAEQRLPEVSSEERRQFVMRTLEGLGSVAPFIAGSAASGPLSLPVGGVLGIAGSEGEMIGQARRERRRAELRDRPPSEGATVEEVQQSAPLAAVAGASEILPVERALSRAVPEGLRRKALQVGIGALEEASQETAGEVMRNLAAREFDPGRDPLEGVREAAETGGGVGFLLNAITTLAGGRRGAGSRARDPEGVTDRERVRAAARGEYEVADPEGQVDTGALEEEVQGATDEELAQLYEEATGGETDPVRTGVVLGEMERRMGEQQVQGEQAPPDQAPAADRADQVGGEPQGPPGEDVRAQTEEERREATAAPEGAEAPAADVEPEQDPDAAFEPRTENVQLEEGQADTETEERPFADVAPEELSRLEEQARSADDTETLEAVHDEMGRRVEQGSLHPDMGRRTQTRPEEQVDEGVQEAEQRRREAETETEEARTQLRSVLEDASDEELATLREDAENEQVRQAVDAEVQRRSGDQETLFPEGETEKAGEQQQEEEPQTGTLFEENVGRGLSTAVTDAVEQVQSAEAGLEAAREIERNRRQQAPDRRREAREVQQTLESDLDESDVQDQTAEASARDRGDEDAPAQSAGEPDVEGAPARAEEEAPAAPEADATERATAEQVNREIDESYERGGSRAKHLTREETDRVASARNRLQGTDGDTENLEQSIRDATRDVARQRYAEERGHERADPKRRRDAEARLRRLQRQARDIGRADEAQQALEESEDASPELRERLENARAAVAEEQSAEASFEARQRLDEAIRDVEEATGREIREQPELPTRRDEDGRYGIDPRGGEDGATIEVTNLETGRQVDGRSSNYNRVVAEYLANEAEALEEGRGRSAEEATTPEGERLRLDQYLERVAAESSNPLEIAEAVAVAQDSEAISSVQDEDNLVAEVLDGPRISTRSFDRVSDPNFRRDNPELGLNWLSREGRALDTYAEELSEIVGREVSEQEVIDILRQYPRRRRTGEPQEVQRLRSRFREVTGVRLTDSLLGELIDRAYSEQRTSTDAQQATQARERPADRSGPEGELGPVEQAPFQRRRGRPREGRARRTEQQRGAGADDDLSERRGDPDQSRPTQLEEEAAAEQEGTSGADAAEAERTVRETANETADRFGLPRVPVVPNSDALPDHVRVVYEFWQDQIGESFEQPALTSPDGQVYLLAESLRRVADQSDPSLEEVARQAYMHEVVAHRGLDGLLGEHKTEVLADVYEALGEEAFEEHGLFEAYADQIERMGDGSLTEESKAFMAEELAATLAEDVDLDPTLWQRLVEALQRAMARVTGQEMSEPDLREMLRAAADHLRRQEGQGVGTGVRAQNGAVQFSRQSGDSDPDEAFRKGAQAMDRVIAEQEDVPEAMTRPDVGPISFLWGEPGDPSQSFAGGHGVSHIIAKRDRAGNDGEQVARKMVEVLAYGTVDREYGPEHARRVDIEYDGHKAVLSLFRHGNRETWLLTGYEMAEKKKASDGTGEAYDSTGPTRTRPTRSRPDAGAEADDTTTRNDDGSSGGSPEARFSRQPTEGDQSQDGDQEGDQEGRQFPEENEVVRRFNEMLEERQDDPQTGRPELANPASDEDVRSTVDVVDESRKPDEEIPEEKRPEGSQNENFEGRPDRESFEQWREQADRMLEDDYEGTKKRLFSGDMDGAADVMAAKEVINREGLEALASGDDEALAHFARMVNAYREQRTDAARELAAGRDPEKTPAERRKEWLLESIFMPGGQTAEALENAETEAERQRVLEGHNEQVVHIRDALRQAGLSPKQLIQEGGVRDRQRMAQAVRLASATKASGRDKFFEYWRNSILSAVTTQSVNFIGNTVHAGWDFLVQRLVEASINEVIPDGLFGGRNQSPRLAEIPRAWRQLLGDEATVEREQELAEANELEEFSDVVDERGPGGKDHEAFMKGALLPTIERAWHRAQLAFDLEAPVLENDLDTEGREKATDQKVQGREAFEVALGTGEQSRVVGRIVESLNDRMEEINGTRPIDVGRTVRIPGRLLNAADQMQKSIFHSMQIAAEAYRMAKADGLEGEALTERVNEQVSDPFGEASMSALEKAQDLAFQSDLGPISDKLLQLRNTKGFLGAMFEYKVPFLYAPTNIIKTSIRKSPFGAANLLWRMMGHGLYEMGVTDDASFRYRRRDFTRHTAEQVIAWTAFYTIGSLVLSDDEEDEPVLTGSAPDFRDQGQYQFFRERGPQPNSIKIGDTYYSYRRVEPLGSMLAMTVDLWSELEDAQEGQDWRETFGEILSSPMKVAKDNPFIQGLGDIYRAIQYPASAGNIVKNVGTGFVPNLIQKGIETTDDVRRDYKVRGSSGREYVTDFLQTMGQEALPLEAYAPPPEADLWGRPLERYEGMSPFTDFLYQNALPLWRRNQNRTTELDRLILNFNEQNQNPPPPYENGFWPAKPRDRFSFRQHDVQMTRQEYHEFVRRAGELSRNRLRRMDLNVENPELVDVEKIDKVIRDTRRQVKYKMIREGRFENLPDELRPTPQESASLGDVSTSDVVVGGSGADASPERSRANADPSRANTSSEASAGPPGGRRRVDDVLEN